MRLAVEMITFDCTDPDGLAQWWATASEGSVTPIDPGEFVMVRRETGPHLAFQRVTDPTPGKNRVHIDFFVADAEAAAQRLVDLGAVEQGRHSFGDHSWVVLSDPAGNAFCVVATG